MINYHIFTKFLHKRCTSLKFSLWGLYITLAAFIIFYGIYFFSPYFLSVNYNADIYISGIKPNVGLILAPTPSATTHITAPDCNLH